VSVRQLVHLASLVCLATACNSLPHPPGENVTTQKGNALEQHSPIEVAIAPINDSSGNTALPRNELRSAFQGALLRRRYTPIALSLVDSKVVNAAYKPGALDEQAVLLLDVQRWDTHLWESRSVIEVTIRARVVAPDNPSGELWSGVLEKRCDFGEVQEQYATEAALRRYACEQIANELLEAMPARQPVPGHSAKP
jgi:hypothetical protein